MDKIFSIKKDTHYKYITFLGLHFRLKRNKLNLKELDSRITKLQAQVDNSEYELADKFNILSEDVKIPKVMSIDETLDLIINHKLSVCRFGDGEFKYLLGENDISKLYFKTENTPLLQKRLKDVLMSEDSKTLVCLWDFWGSLDKFENLYKEIARLHLTKFRQSIYQYINFNKMYGNAFMSRPYISQKDKNKSKDYFNKLKQIWAEKDIVIIEGEGSRLGVGNDLFEGVKSIERIIAPAENAWAKYDEILESAKTISKDKLVLIALGMTATVLAYDLSQLGYWAIDIGHADIEYECFLKRTTKMKEINNKYVNDERIQKYVPCTDSKYLSEIVAEVG